jgi:hypothetical protein
VKPGIRAGAIAGAVGTLALDVVSYGDMLARGRAASDLPAQAAAKVAETVGVDLGPADDPRTPNRRAAFGAILGYSTGVAVGAVLGGAWRFRRQTSTTRRGLTAAALAMAAANGPMVAQGLTDPRTWGVAGWVSDVVPHVAYGLATAVTYRAVTR